MKKFIAFAFAILMFSSCTEKPTVTGSFDVIPLPQEIKITGENGFTLKKSTKITYPAGNDQLRRTAEFLSEYIAFSTGYSLKVTDRSHEKNAIVLTAGAGHDEPEAYRMTVASDRITIDGSSEAGTFYGVQTLRKAIPPYSDGAEVSLPAAEINDFPRFAYRGMHLDVARHIFPLDFIKEYIDILALHNINTFHWHLSDDQGWRIEVKALPKLTEVGGYRSGTLIGHGGIPPFEYDGEPYGGFYTQEQAREIVAYAAERFITVIPEIDLPGHMTAALTAYPELGCTGGPYEVVKRWGVFPEILCAGKETTFEFIETVFAELLDIFPSQYIHVGGDEAPKDRWKECPHCHARIKELGLKSDREHSAEERLQSYMISRVEKMLGDMGRDIIGWDEILEGGLAPGATVMSWRGVEGGITAARMNHDAIMVPTGYFYFDYYQSRDRESEPFGIGGYVPVEKVYGFDLPEELTEDEKQHIIGVQANLWTEYTKTPEVAEFRILPRIDALSEVQWTLPASKDFDSFRLRLERMRELYEKQGWNYAPHIFE